jgi:mono/diheme cytochrome c family protein
MATQARTGTVIISTVLVTLVAIAALGYWALVSGALPANADARPGGLERWAAHTSLGATIASAVTSLHDSLPTTDSVLVAGVHLYGANCAVCHGTSDGQPSTIAIGLYQHAPQFAKHDVSDDPVEETYWKITHGIRLTGMPSYSRTLSEPQRWAIAKFLRHQDSLPPVALAAWKALPSAAIDNGNGPIAPAAR